MYGSAVEWLNYHHLRYFWTVARKGGVRKAAEELHVSQPSISAQLGLLEESLGEKLFKRSGRNLVLTEVGHVVLSYADEIFSAGRELINAVKQRPSKRPLRLNIGITDAVSKLITFEILKAAFRFTDPMIHIVCREGEIGPLVNQLQAHRLDIVLADEPASSSLKAKTFNHRLGRSGITFCAVPALATKLRRNFPKSLNGAPALLPSENMGMRAALETWFDAQGIRPRVIGEFEDSALMEVCASGGRGFTVVHTVVDRAALKHYGLRVIAKVEECGSDFYAITAERRVKHPAAVAITEHAYSHLFV
ncbi:MAG TPA: LysR family transcriptional regulator [Chthoniobacterales bacterium]|nr:LysR family transcriptional regulator [Chthoniobacterales bacterium]